MNAPLSYYVSELRTFSMRYAQRFRTIRVIIFQTVVIILLTFFLGEIVLRIYNNYVPSFIFYSSSYERFRGRPFADDWNFNLNSQGFKDEEFSEKRNDTYRILGIGDSFSFGVVPYEYNYLTLIESQFHQENVGVELLNMGVPSLSPKDYLSLLMKEGLVLQPDMVLLSFFIGNDFEVSKRKLREYSYIASLLHYIINIQDKYEGQVIHGKGKYCDDCPFFDQEQYLKLEFSRSSIYLVDNKSFPEKLYNALYYLKEIIDICKKHNIKLVVAIIPDELQINQDLLREVKETYNPSIASNKWNITLPNRTLSNELDKLGVDNIDLYEYFAGSAQQLYRPRDTHWNIAGNQLAANIIQEHIRKHITH